MSYHDIIKADQGKKFGLVESPDYNAVYHKHNSLFLKMLLDQINKDNICIADYGGGNGILAKKLIKMCKNKGFNKFTIENIDIDKSKFEDIPHLVNIEKDIVNYKAENRYDFTISRFVLHYIPKEKQLAFLKTINNNLKVGGFFLFIHYIEGNAESIIHDFVIKELSIKRGPFLSKENVLAMIKEAGFEIVEVKEVSDVLSIKDLHKHKFQLSDFQVEELIRRVGSKKFEGKQIAVLIRKP